MENASCLEWESGLIGRRQVGDVLVLTAPACDLDAHAARGWRQTVPEAAREAGARAVVLDLRAVRLIDAAGWAMLIAVNQRLRREGCRLRLLLATGSQPFRAFVTRWLHVVLDRVDGLDELTGGATDGDGPRQAQGTCE